MSKKILYIFDFLDRDSRVPLAIEASKAGYDVTIGLVGGDARNLEIDESAPVHFIHIPKPKNKFGPLSVLLTIKAIHGAIKNSQPDLVHAVTLKYSFLVGLACQFAGGFKIIFTLAGLGFLFRTEGWKPRALRTVLSPVLKWVLKDKRARIIFQNPDDRDLLVQGKYVRAEKTDLVISSGVDLGRFSASAMPDQKIPIVLMVTRLVKEKGVLIFAQAAKKLKDKGVNARFQIAGGLTKHNPNALSEADMQEMVSSGAVEWLGKIDDVPKLLEQSTCIVYPSYYGEGVPRVLIEACAAGRAIISTDNPGCKEPVFDGENGFLIPIKDINATAIAMEKLIENPDLCRSMGRKSREIAERDFDVNQILSQTLAVYKKAL